MKHTILAITVFAIAKLASSQVASARQALPSAPTHAGIEQGAMQQGPSTGRIGYLTHEDLPAPKRAEAPVDPKLLRPLTQREAGMFYNACIAYPECKTAYSKAYEHDQALRRAQKAKVAGRAGQ